MRDLVSDEVATFLRYREPPQQIANTVRREYLAVGPASRAIGYQNEIYLILQHSWRTSQPSIGAITSLKNDEFSEEDPTLAELSEMTFRPSNERRQVFSAMCDKAAKTLAEAGGLRPIDAEIQATKFISEVLQHPPRQGQSARDFMIEVLTEMGCTPNDFNESSKLSDLASLSVFRSQLALLRTRIGCSPDDLKSVQPTDIPSEIVKSALNKFGQKRKNRPASDLNDKYLASLMPYVDYFVADKRTRHDLSLVGKKSKLLNSLKLGEILSTPDYVSAGERILKAAAAR